MAAITQVNLLTQVDTIVEQAKRAVPGAKQADVVNSLTRAYCPYVDKDASVPAARKGPVLDRFATLVYTQYSHPNRE